MLTPDFDRVTSRCRPAVVVKATKDPAKWASPG
jgi:hypothetical protein